jgi:endonuclease/exonuclease/phosphatase family metal-dependent hydrolase
MLKMLLDHPFIYLFLAFYIYGCDIGSVSKSSAQTSIVPVEKDYTLRVLTYNIYHGESTNGDIDMDLFGKIIKELNPDLVALQEVDKETSRVNGLDLTAELSKRTGLNGYFCKHRDFQGGEYGNAILSRFPIDTIYMQTGYRTSNIGVTIPYAKVEIDRDTYIYFNSSHLSTDPEIRKMHTKQLVDYYTNSLARAPLLICGDLNAEPDSEEMEVILKEFSMADTTLANTFSTRTGMRKKIDYILFPASGNWDVIETKVICRGDASDHCALFAVLKIRI